MFSSAGKTFDRTKIIQPLNRQQRLKVYSSQQVKIQAKHSSPKFSPFNTVSRTKRDSYLLRVTNQPNVNTNYELVFSSVLPLHRRSTIDQASFTRIIGDVRTQNFQVPLTSNNPKRCHKSVSKGSKPKPLTARDCQSWRKTFHHYDFSKQSISQREKQSRMFESTMNTFDEKTLRETVQSNFNNFDRFNFKGRTDKAHMFQSDSGHQYLTPQEVESKRTPEYDTLVSKQDIIKPSMNKPHGQNRFYQYRDKITTRQDRADPQWFTNLQYDIKEINENKTIDVNKSIDRKPNSTHSKYPIRLSLSKILAVRQRP